MNPDVVVEHLQRILDEGIHDERDVNAMGQLGFHPVLLSMSDSSPDGSISDLANELVTRCVRLSSDGCFPVLSRRVEEYNSAFAGRNHPAYFTHDVGGGISLCIKSRAEKAAAVENMLWPASLSLARWIAKNQREVLSRAFQNERDGKFRALEIGAGLGTVGIAVCKLLESIYTGTMADDQRGLTHETFVTDRTSRITSTIRENVLLNNLDPELQCIPCVLDWDFLNPSSGKDTLDHHDNLASYTTPNSFDLIVGSEVVHELGHDDGVLSAIKLYLKREKGCRCYLMLSHEHHRYAVKEFKDKVSCDPDLDYRLFLANFNDDERGSGCFNKYELHQIEWNV